ncbi:MAG: hypothetical protein CL843_03375 [Crocinitomicaceae bacterium]|nr:hypothetical protein [Crocinitomicaceae bacterium]|tara:strand:+ start:10194 stop:10550 length:357 start_codon:yes stop_codon:yes gene_type:complete
MRLLILFFIAFISQSFLYQDKEKQDFSGVYSCSCEEANPLTLKINSDNTFIYHDPWNKEGDITITGTWKAKRNVLHLNSDNPELKFHDKWKVVSEGEAVKSRKGMTFYRLVDASKCNQ